MKKILRLILLLLFLASCSQGVIIDNNTVAITQSEENQTSENTIQEGEKSDINSVIQELKKDIAVEIDDDKLFLLEGEEKIELYDLATTNAVRPEYLGYEFYDDKNLLSYTVGLWERVETHLYNVNTGIEIVNSGDENSFGFSNKNEYIYVCDEPGIDEGVFKIYSYPELELIQDIGKSISYVFTCPTGDQYTSENLGIETMFDGNKNSIRFHTTKDWENIFDSYIYDFDAPGLIIQN